MTPDPTSRAAVEREQLAKIAGKAFGNSLFKISDQQFEDAWVRGDNDGEEYRAAALAMADAILAAGYAKPSLPPDGTLFAFVEELADSPCGYDDNCPPHGTRHGQCLACRARAALAGAPSGPEAEKR